MAWIRLLVATLARWRWRCPAFCQMGTHVHVLLHVDDCSLPLGMKHLNGEYSKHFNVRHSRAGQFVRRRYGSRRVELNRDLLSTYAYVVSNPVDAGLCPRAEDWRWSSFATTLGLTRDFPFVDAAPVLAELGGSVDALRDLVSFEQSPRLARRAMFGV